MKMRETFKNPDDASEGSELDELVSDADEYDLPPIEMDAENDLDASLDDVEDINEGGLSESDSSLFEPSGTDDSMTDSEDGENETNKQYKDIKTGECNSAGYDGPGGSGGNVQRCRKNNNLEKDNENEVGCVHDYNEDEEDDETVRAIIAAIKKPRTVPPEIKIDDFITDICFHPQRDIIALATITGDVCLYEYANEGNNLLRNIEVHAKACRDVEFTEDGCNLLTCSKDKSIMVTDMETEKLKKFYETAHDEAINKLHVIDENLFATGDDGGTVKLWDLRTKDAIFALKEVEDYITGMLTNEAKKLLLVTSGDGYLTTLNIGARKLFVQSEPYEEELTCMGLYRADSKLVVGTSKGRLYTYNWGQFGYHCDTYPGIKTPLSEMIPITDRVGCVAGEEGIIRAVHITPYRNLGIVGQHNMPIESIDISWTGELIASSSHNNDVRFWNVKYFEDFGEIKYNEKHNNFKDRRHNLPSSRVGNAGDFFADLAKEDNNGDDN